MEEAVEDLDSASETSSSFEEETWIQWFCNEPGNELFCEIEKAYIQDTFNLYGIRNYLRLEEYNIAMDTILDKIDPVEGFEAATKMLYSLIHARYILTTAGQERMRDKYHDGVFGYCPRALCLAERVLPIGLSDEPFQSPVKLYCPKCQDVYSSPKFTHYDVDGAAFTTTFPHLFFMTFNDLVPEKNNLRYIPKVFGFKIHPSSLSNPKPAPVPPFKQLVPEANNGTDSWDEGGSIGNGNKHAEFVSLEKRKVDAVGSISVSSAVAESIPAVEANDGVPDGKRIKIEKYL